MNKKYVAFMAVLLLIMASGCKNASTQTKASGGDDMVPVPAGEFMMGCNEEVDSDCDADESPYHKVYLDDYKIDKLEVTMDQYDECVKAGKCTAPNYDDGNCYLSAQTNDQGVLPETFRGPHHPVVCVNWSQAKDYCASLGKRLPTEAEWEKAARGTDGRKYPWGNDPISSKKYGNFGSDSTMPVGSFPDGASPYGALDMQGNVAEWTADWFGDNYYSESPRENPQGPVSGDARVMRGGSYDYTDSGLRNSFRSGTSYEPTNGVAHTGIRCVK